MTRPKLWLLVVAGSVGVAAAGSSRAFPWLLGVAAVAAAWVARGGWPGVAIACLTAGVAWATAVGPWSGAARWWVALAAGAAVGITVAVVAGRAPRITVAVAALFVVAALPFLREPPTSGAPADDDRLRAVDTYLADQVNRAAVPGAAVVIVENGQIVFARGYGRAQDTISMTPDTPVVIGSTSKSVTAVATLQLAEQSRLDLDASLGEYLSWLAPVDRRVSDITIRQLLIDTSGIPTWAGWSALAGDGGADAAAIRRLINNLRLSSAPGKRFQYSNANYIVLGQVIEAVAGKPYGDVVEASVFQPLGMVNTHAAATDESVANRYWFGVPLRSHLPYLAVGIPAGAITSSASDLARYLQNQLDPSQQPTVLSPASVRLSHTPAVKAEGFGVAAGRHYAMGWYTGSISGEPAVFHSGDVFDSSSSLITLPERDIGIAVVATTSSTITPVSKTLGEGVVAKLIGRESPDLGRSLAIGTMLAVAVAGAVLAFAVVRGRDLFALRRHGTSPASLARVAVIDFALPLAVLLGLPALFSHYLDRAESITAVEFWRLVLRGVPDVGLLLALALLGRLAAATVTGLRWTIEVLRPVETTPAR